MRGAVAFGIGRVHLWGRAEPSREAITAHQRSSEVIRGHHGVPDRSWAAALNGQRDGERRKRSRECLRHVDPAPCRSSRLPCTRTTRSATGRRRSRVSACPARGTIRRCARTVRKGSAHSRPWEAARHAPRENATSTESTASRRRTAPAPCRSPRPPCTRTTGSAIGRRRTACDASQGP